jgi:hypothetical protein
LHSKNGELTVLVPVSADTGEWRGATIYSFQAQLLSRIIKAGELNKVVQWGITRDDFTMAETQGFFDQMIAYHSAAETAGSIYGVNSQLYRFPGFAFCDDDSMSTEAICVEVRKEKIKVRTRQLLQDATDLISVDPQGAVTLLREKSAALQNDCTPKNLDVHIADSMERVWSNYCAGVEGKRVSVFNWPWQPLQEATLGVREADYIIFYARPKCFKSWMLCYLVAYAICVNRDFRVLIYSREMPADEVFERIGCALAAVDYEHFTRGQLAPNEKFSLQYSLNELRTLREQMTVVCLDAQNVKTGQDTVSWLESKIDRYQPQAVFVDGLYLMSDQQGSKRTHERVSNVSRSIRQLVLHKHIPVIATVQANRDAAKNEDANLEEVAFSDSLGQDATMLIRIVNEWKRSDNSLALVMGGASRRFRLDGFRIYGIPAHNFRYLGELSAREAQALVRADIAGGKAKAPKPLTTSNGASKAEDKKREETMLAQGAADIAGMVTSDARH